MFSKMILLVLFGLLASGCAAPRYHHGASPPFHDDLFHQRFFEEDIFDTRSFWDELRRDLHSLDTIVDDFVKRFPSSVSSEAIDGNLYRITISLPGFEEKDIVVKASKGLVMIQAVHRDESGSEKTYLDMRTLPACVNETGKWVYEGETLKIEFPLENKDTNAAEQPTTENSAADREEMETDNGDTSQNADVGADRGDLGEDVKLLTNTVPGANNHVEATTYAVDLKDEVEFVPVRQVK